MAIGYVCREVSVQKVRVQRGSMAIRYVCREVGVQRGTCACAERYAWL